MVSGSRRRIEISGSRMPGAVPLFGGWAMTFSGRSVASSRSHHARCSSATTVTMFSTGEVKGPNGSLASERAVLLRDGDPELVRGEGTQPAALSCGENDDPDVVSIRHGSAIVADVMTQVVVTVTPETPARRAIDRAIAFVKTGVLDVTSPRSLAPAPPPAGP